ncbi:MAG TPA: sigma-70 family RNA polymerase sigma factor, partial [Planctomycetota bacterium]
MEPMPTSAMLLQHGRFVRELARALLRDRHAAEDVAQEVWLQAWRHAETLATPRAWLRRAARSLASNRRRAEERRARHESLAAADEPGCSPLEESARSELLHRVVDAVFALEEPLRGTILARYFRGLDVRALAAESGVPPSTVRDRERRALELLRRRLDRGTGGREAWAIGLALLTPRATSLGPAGGLLVVLGVAGAALAMLAALAGSFEEPAPSAVDPAIHATLGTGAASDGAAQAPTPEVASARSEAHGVAPESTPDPATELDLLVGRTLDLEGRPLAGVRLRFERARREVLRTLSDEEGRFRVEDMPAFTSVAAEHPGYRLLRATDPETDVHQPYRPMRVTLVPVGALELCVRDEDGQPLPGVVVSVSPRAKERLDPAVPDSCLRLPGDQTAAETDASGYARLEDIWTGIHLALQLDLEAGADTGQVQVERALGGRLLLDRPQGGPIVVRPGRVLTLEATWGAARALRGVVVDERGLPVGGCRVDLEDEGYEPREDGHRLGSTVSGDSGEFELGFRTPGLRGPVRIVASRQGSHVPIGQLPVGSIAVCAARGEVRLEADELPPNEPVLVQLLPTRDALLYGEVRASDGTPLDWSSHRLATLSPDTLPTCAYWSGGAFSIHPLPLEPQDIVVVTQG